MYHVDLCRNGHSERIAQWVGPVKAVWVIFRLLRRPYDGRYIRIVYDSSVYDVRPGNRITAEAAWEREFQGYVYGPEEMAQARGWFEAGFQAGREP